MDPTLIGFVGTLIGALAAIAGVLLTNRLQAAREQKDWLRSKKEEAYSQSIRSLLRVSGRRSKVRSDGRALLSESDIKDWFDDCINSQHWIAQISIYSPKAFKAHRIGEKAKELKAILDGLVAGSVRLKDPFDLSSRSTYRTGSGKGLYITASLPDHSPDLVSQAHELNSETESTSNQERFVSIPKIATELLERVIAAARDDLGKQIQV